MVNKSIKNKITQYLISSIEYYATQVNILNVMVEQKKEGYQETLVVEKYQDKTEEELKQEIKILNMKIDEYKNSLDKLAKGERKLLYGWQYLPEISYLTEKQKKDFEDIMKREFPGFSFVKYSTKEKSSILEHLNKLTYYKREIEYIETFQKNQRRARAETEPIREILKILNYIGDDNPATEPILTLLASMKLNYSSEIKSFRQREYYNRILSEKQELKRKPLSLDEWKIQKKEYNLEVEKLYSTIKKIQKHHFIQARDSILQKLNLKICYKIRLTK